MKAIVCFTMGLIFVALTTGLFLAGSTKANVEARTCLVPGDYATIQSAVDDQACSGINLGTGTFKENVTISRTVNIQGQGAEYTIVNGAGNNVVFSILESSTLSKPDPITVTLNGLAIRDGQYGVDIGTHLTIDTSLYVYLKNCSISNHATDGILNGGKTKTLVDTCSVSGNLGRGILNGGYGDLTVVNSSIFNNSGVGIYNNGCHRFSSCRAYVRLDRSTVSGNMGGGIYAGYGRAQDEHRTPGTIFSIINSTISGNTAGLGGGIYVCGGLSLYNSTVSDNSAGSGGGIYVNSSFPYGCSGSVRAANSIVANNLVGGDCVLFEDEYTSGRFSDYGHNIVKDGTCISSETSISGDPLLGPLAYNGGPTLTHALSPDSPALDTGDSDFCPDTDQRGYPRPIDGDKNGSAECDIGSNEYILLDYYMALPMVTR